MKVKVIRYANEGFKNHKIKVLIDGEIKEIAYEETESYKLTELFIRNKELVLSRLLNPDD